MGLMRGIRRNIKGIYWVVVVIVVISFVFWGTRLGVRGGRKYAGTVFGKKVSLKEFSLQARVAQRYAQQMEGRIGRAMTSEEIENIAWRRVMELREAGRMGIMIPLAEVKEQIRLMFSPGGTFDETLYRNTLYYRGATEEEFAETLRDDMKIGELESLIADTVVVPPSELREAFDYEKEQRKIKFHMVESAPLTEAFDVSDAGEPYYRSHRGEFREPNKVAVQYLMVEPEALADEVSLSGEEVKEYYEKNKSFYKGAQGQTATFEEVRGQIEHVLRNEKADALARKKAEEIFTFSEASRMREIAEKNGLVLQESGLIPQEGDVNEEPAKEPEFRKAAFDTALGGVSPVIKTRVGYCVLSPVRIVPERIPPFEEVQEIAAQKQRAQQLKQAAIQAGLLPEQVDAFVEEHSVIPAALGVTEEDVWQYYNTHKVEFRKPKKVKVEYLVVEKAPFEKEVKVTEKEIKSEYQQNDWKYKGQDGKVKPLTDVREEIEKALREKKADEKARERADEVFMVSRPQRLKEYAKKQALELRESRLFAQGETIDDYMGDSPAFAKVALTTNMGEVSQSFRTDVGYCILSPVQVVEEAVADFEEVVEEATEKAKQFKAEMLAGTIARELQREVNEKVTKEKESFETGCKELDLKVEESGYFRRDDRTIDGIGAAAGVPFTAFQSEPGQVNYPRKTDKGYFFFAVSEVKPPTDEEFTKEKDTYYAEKARDRRQQAFREWSVALWEEANVKSALRPSPKAASKPASKESAEKAPRPTTSGGGMAPAKR
jgi:peptidyl-prolyl cis-trans isomerase D